MLRNPESLRKSRSKMTVYVLVSKASPETGNLLRQSLFDDVIGVYSTKVEALQNLLPHLEIIGPIPYYSPQKQFIEDVDPFGGIIFPSIPYHEPTPRKSFNDDTVLKNPFEFPPL